MCLRITKACTNFPGKMTYSKINLSKPSGPKTENLQTIKILMRSAICRISSEFESFVTKEIFMEKKTLKAVN